MLLTFHSLAGAAIAKKIKKPYFSWPLALVSHFVLDSLPHWDFFTDGIRLSTGIYFAILFDFLLGLSLGLFFALRGKSRADRINSIGSSFFACFPDGLSALWVFFNFHPYLVDLSLQIHRAFHFVMPLPWGMGAPLLLAAGVLYFLLR